MIWIKVSHVMEKVIVAFGLFLLCYLVPLRFKLFNHRFQPPIQH